MVQEALRPGFLFDAVRGEGVEIFRRNVGCFVAQLVMHCCRRHRKERAMHDELVTALYFQELLKMRVNRKRT